MVQLKTSTSPHSGRGFDRQHKILVVSENLLMLTALKEELKDITDYEVLIETNRDKVGTIFQGIRIDVLVLEFSPSEELIENYLLELKEMRPHVKIVAMSEPETIDPGGFQEVAQLTGELGILRTPFMKKDFLRKMEEVLFV